MESLFLSANKLKGMIPSSLGDSLHRLQFLNLGDNRLTGPVPASFVSLTNLKQLSLHRNKLSGAVPKCIESMGGLHLLLLWENNFTGLADALDASALTALRVVNLTSNPLKHKTSVRLTLDLQLPEECQLYI